MGASVSAEALQKVMKITPVVRKPATKTELRLLKLARNNLVFSRFCAILRAYYRINPARSIKKWSYPVECKVMTVASDGLEVSKLLSMEIEDFDSDVVESAECHSRFCTAEHGKIAAIERDPRAVTCSFCQAVATIHESVELMQRMGIELESSEANNLILEACYCVLYDIFRLPENLLEDPDFYASPRFEKDPLAIIRSNSSVIRKLGWGYRIYTQLYDNEVLEAQLDNQDSEDEEDDQDVVNLLTTALPTCQETHVDFLTTGRGPLTPNLAILLGRVQGPVTWTLPELDSNEASDEPVLATAVSESLV